MRRFLFPFVLLTALLLVAVAQLPSAASQQQAGPESYFPIVRRDPPPTPTPTATPVPVTGTGIFKKVGDTLYEANADGTIFYGRVLDWQDQVPTTYSIYARACFETGPIAGECEWSAQGHDFAEGRFKVIFGGQGEKYEGEGFVQLYMATYPPGTRDDIVGAVSKEYDFDTENGYVWAMDFRECRSDDTGDNCNPDEWFAPVGKADATEEDGFRVLSKEEFEEVLKSWER